MLKPPTRGTAHYILPVQCIPREASKGPKELSKDEINTPTSSDCFTEACSNTDDMNFDPDEDVEEVVSANARQRSRQATGPSDRNECRDTCCGALFEKVYGYLIALITDFCHHTR